jgi:hypothetical protein
VTRVRADALGDDAGNVLEHAVHELHISRVRKLLSANETPAD